ncbi:ribonuclease HII [Xaviernesmea oryzae]|uniref:Ribonuclease HII n=1 Tax=Xaviernesmea oryzae TaxID=464029 RepID=A0A1Q9ATI5_9HYPH|nr:ribonuclease HII [Xaviernesmea oryzae]OLP58723.1 ribonuclease HII [Xaviernesmea oryzae]SEK70100.1 RNase HII [Xaviernesmea oryzae]
MKRARKLDSPDLFDSRIEPDYALERAAIESGLFPVAGTDEAGRGPLAGPVVAAAVILEEGHGLEGLNDSKLLTPVRREALFDQILSRAVVSIASSGAGRIDLTDIRKASLDAMRRAVLGLPLRPALVLADGRDVPPGLPCQGQAVIKGDQRSLSIAAASIVAKVARDRMMARADHVYPGYGFAAHAGYATVIHRDAIRLHGPCRLHRMSFRPLRADPGEPGIPDDDMIAL